MTVIKAPALRKGDAIGVVVPAGPVNRERIDRALERLRRRGFFPKIYGDVYRRHRHLAGDDATRAGELARAFADSDTTAVWCARGGYGTSRILDRLDFELIREHPKVFVGFSDITAIHLAIQQRLGLITFHGPNLQDGFGMPDDMTAATEENLWPMVMGEMPTGLAVKPRTSGGRREYESPMPCPMPRNLEAASETSRELQLRPISPGIAKGRLTGGNLSVISGLMGTPFEIETDGRILFLEDLDESPYKIDRYLSQLQMAGKLHAAAGILLGGFVDDQKEVSPETLCAIDNVLVEYCSGLGVPVLANFPAGHQRFNTTLPIHAMVELDAGRRSMTVLEYPTA